MKYLIAVTSLFIAFCLSCTPPPPPPPLFGPIIEISNSTIADIDGNVYHTVTIGTQTWTVENLKTTHYNDSTPISLVTDSAAWANLKTPGYCWYGNDSTNMIKYGALYNWFAVNTGKLAPSGWHVPSDAEWDTLDHYLIANGYNWDGTTRHNKIAKSMAAQTDWFTSTHHVGAIGNDLSKNNNSGFSALPGGCRSSSDVVGDFNNFHKQGHWWSATEYHLIQLPNLPSKKLPLPCNFFLIYGAYNLRMLMDVKSSGVSVRCVQD